MRIQILDLPTPSVGEARQAPYILVMSEMPTHMEGAAQNFRKAGFDQCAGIIATTDVVRIGEESLDELQAREEREEAKRIEELLIEHRLPYGSIVGGPLVARQVIDGAIVDEVGLMHGALPREDRESTVLCPEQVEGRGCACSLGAQDCPINGRTPAAIGVMDIAPETRAVSVTENEGGTRVAHIAIDVDQTPEELASDVAAIVEEQREFRPGMEYRQMEHSCDYTCSSCLVDAPR